LAPQAVNSASFVPPVIILPNVDFFIVFDNRVGLRLPISTNTTLVTHYFNGPPTWNGPFSTQRWNYQINCCGGGATPVLGNVGTPRLGGQFQVTLAQAKSTTLGLLFTGYSNSNWNGVPLPFDLGQLGAPGCSLLAAGHSINAVATDANGAGSTNLTVPNDNSLCSGQIYQQWIVVDAGANNLGFAFSNGGAGILGG
jgi:hypothetical protein